MTTTCVNLREHFGKRYRVVYEESYYAEYGPGARVEDPWLMVIPCRWGHIYPHGGETLAASVDGYRKIAGQLRKLPCCRVHQDGDFGELTVLFYVVDFAQVAKVMRPKRRRPPQTEAQRLAAARNLRPFPKVGLSPVDNGHITAPESPLGLPVGS